MSDVDVKLYEKLPPGPGHWVAIRLDGCESAWATPEDPVVPAMRRLTAAKLSKKEPREKDVSAVRAWLEVCASSRLVV